MIKLTTKKGELREEVGQSLDDLAREGARRMIEAALIAETSEYVERLRSCRDEAGHAMITKNGYGETRKLTVGSGTVEIKSPRVYDRRLGEKFTSSILPPYMRRSPKVSEVLPILYLKGISTGNFSSALTCLLGEDACLSAATITRLKNKWMDEYRDFKNKDLSCRAYVYVFADGVNVKVRLGDDNKVCLLVAIGVTLDGKKEVIAVEDGYRESKEGWLTLLRDLKRRGMASPNLVIGDGHLGIWAAINDIWPKASQQLCWVHKEANVLDKLPKRIQGKAKDALHQMMYAPTKAICLSEMNKFKADYEAKYPKAVDSLFKNIDKLLTFFDYPAEHWIHLRSTNVIESAFATVKLRTNVTKGAGSRNAALTMAFKLLAEAEKHWQCFNGKHQVAKVRNGVIFIDGIEQIKEKERVA